MLVRQPHGMSAADARDLLSGSVRAVIQQACSGFQRDAAFGAGVHVAALDLFHVVRQQLHAVRIHAAQVGGHQRFGDQARGGPREGRGFQQPGRPGSEIFG
jgi:hypothetical protein